MVIVSYITVFHRAKEVVAGRAANVGRPLAGLNDDELVERCRNHDHEAFTEVVERYKDRVHGLIARMVGTPQAEDLAQEVFLRAYQAIEGFEGRSAFRTWLYRIAHNLCLTELRKRQARGEHVSIDEEGDEKVHRLVSDPPRSLEDEIEGRDLSEKVQRLIGRLPVNYRTVLTLFYLQQVRYEEIAEIMGIPLGTVKTHIHRARLRLRDLVLAEPDIAGLLGTIADGASDGWSEAS
jgi:RNA polymerase sigma-70 factor (ECF subfamily)